MELAILAGVGLVGGYRLATVAAQRWQEDAAEEVLARGAAAAVAPSAVLSAAATAQSSKHAPKLAEAAVTLMLVGDSEVGKTLLCARLVTAAAAEALAHEAARTVAPTWRRAEADVLLDAAHARPTRVAFQLLDTPGADSLSQLLVPFYRSCDVLALVFSVASSASFARLQSTWFAQARAQRLNVGRPRAGTAIIVAHVIDERASRQVSRRDAASWCADAGLPYFELSQTSDTAYAREGWERMLQHVARVALGYKVQEVGGASFVKL